MAAGSSIADLQLSRGKLCSSLFGNSPALALQARDKAVCTMRFWSTAKVLAKCKLQYYRISECCAQLTAVLALSCKTILLVTLGHLRHAAEAQDMAL